MSNYDGVELITRNGKNYSIIKIKSDLFKVSLHRWVNYLQIWKWKLQGTFPSFYQAYHSLD